LIYFLRDQRLGDETIEKTAWIRSHDREDATMHATSRLVPKLLLSTLMATALSLLACGPQPAAEAPADGKAAAVAPKATEAAAAKAPGGLLPLPEFKPCAGTAHPQLPAKWEAVALMEDFFLNSFWVGKFVYDESAQAFRFSLVDQYGIEEDLLVTTDRKLYRLTGGEQPTSCTYLTAKSPYTVPSRDWLDAGAVCVGQAPLLNRQQQWWKSPSGQGANWFWYDASNKLPFRSMYYVDAKPTTPVPIYEHFTFNYFPTFKEVPATNLAKILASARAATRPRRSPRRSSPARRSSRCRKRAPTPSSTPTGSRRSASGSPGSPPAPRPRRCRRSGPTGCS